jgi:hypothetical protein
MPEFETRELTLWEKFTVQTMSGRGRYGRQAPYFAAPLTSPVNPRFKHNETDAKRWYWHVLTAEQREQLFLRSASHFRDHVQTKILDKRQVERVSYGKTFKHVYCPQRWVAERLLSNGSPDSYCEVGDGQVVSCGEEYREYPDEFGGLDWPSKTFAHWVYAVSVIPPLWDKWFPRLLAQHVVEAYVSSAGQQRQWR